MHNILIIFLTTLLCLGTSKQLQEEKPWPAELNTAKEAAWLSELEQNVILELNKVRSNPKRYAVEYLEELQVAFNGKIFTYPGQYPLKSQEGVAPLIECISLLKGLEPLPLLNSSQGLTKAAEDLLKDQQKFGGIGHLTRNGTTPQKRIERYGEWDICSAEDITYGSNEARQIVIALLIDDGVPERSHRKNILNPCFRFVGVAFGTHPGYQTMCVIDYAGDYKNK